MQRKPTFPSANIKMPDPANMSESHLDEETEQQQKRQQLINFGHSQWGFNNWSWSVTKQELDFVEYTSGKHTAGVVSYVCVNVKSFDIHRENIGYATMSAPSKGLAIYKARKIAVTNALRETLLSFGGSVSTELLELLESNKREVSTPVPIALPEPQTENNQNSANVNKPAEAKNAPLNRLPKKEEGVVANARSPLVTAPVKNVPSAPVAKAHPIPANLPPAANRPPPLAANTPRMPAAATPATRPNSNDAPPVPSKPLESMTEEEARAERKRRQKLAQEEFRLKQMMKQGGNDEIEKAVLQTGKQETEKPDLQKSSIDALLLNIPTQDIVIEESGNAEAAKRKSPTSGADIAAKRRGIFHSKLDIVTD